ncbi:hypothetical protein BZG02_19445 [Labilibaculum filiforme]|uniref:histidine kinase n=1 Tax=Labilibaculum filiforme TaxID=1940526 RepID=A0A2N3HQX0_9BACT|nr:tetratricopeptide repeat-containing sensor histidine kinase [Labilibaculum filiforme]PKQ60439.1 hypothetical protein BZG02_19445 [Labilibaculum filiforme]
MKYYILLFFIFLSKVSLSQINVDSLEALLIEKQGLERVLVLNDLSHSYWNSNPVKGLNYAKEAYEIALEKESKIHIAKSLQNIGINYWAEGEVDEALKYFKKALPIFIELDDFRGYASVLSNLGVVYKTLSDYDNSLSYYIQSLEICEERNFITMKRKTLGNISLVYLALNNHDKALTYIQDAIALCEEEENDGIITAHYNTLGQIYEAKKDYINAQVYYKKALKQNIKNENHYGTTICLYNIGNAKFNLKEYAEAKKYFQESRAVSEKINDQIGVLYADKSIGLLYAIQKKNKEALHYYDKALSLAISLNSREQQLEIYKNYSNVFKSLENYEKALEYFELSSSIKDSIYNEKSSRQIAEMQTKYESVKKEKENELLRKASEIQQLALTKQTNLRNFVIVLLVLVILVVVILMNRNKIKHDTNVVLSQKNKLIEDQKSELVLKNEELIEKHKELKNLNAMKDKFFKIISHDLKGPFNCIIGFTELLKEDYTILNDEARVDMINDIDRSSQHAYELLSNLLTWAQTQTGEITINKIFINLKELVTTSVDLYGLNAPGKNIDIVVNVPDDLKLMVDKNTSMIVIGNIINNAIKFTPEGGLISINVIEKKNYINLHIVDTGVGMPPEILQKLFRIDENVSCKGTNNEKGTGLGLILCKEFIEKNGGCIDVNSNIGKGSEFIVTLPKS